MAQGKQPQRGTSESERWMEANADGATNFLVGALNSIGDKVGGLGKGGIGGALAAIFGMGGGGETTSFTSASSGSDGPSNSMERNSADNRPPEQQAVTVTAKSYSPEQVVAFTAALTAGAMSAGLAWNNPTWPAAMAASMGGAYSALQPDTGVALDAPKALTTNDSLPMQGVGQSVSSGMRRS